MIPKIIREPLEIIDERHKTGIMDYFLLRIKSIFNRVKYVSLIVVVYIVCEYRMLTLNGAKGKWWVFAMFYLIDTFFLYFNCYFVYPKAYEKRRTIYQPFLLIIPVLIIYYLLSILGYCLATDTFGKFFKHLSSTVSINFVWRVINVSAFAAIPFGFYTFAKMLKREKVLENNALYSRISPHLIFNALNFIHSDLRNISLKADKMITYLSEYSRYAMAELAEDGKANLEAELEQLGILINMNKLRFDTLYVTLHLDLKMPAGDYRIPPQLIGTLAENIFKYGITTDKEMPVTIEIFDQPKLLYIKMSNHKAKQEGVISHKLGLENLRKRLQNIYGDFFTLKIEETEERFSVNLIIPV